MTSVRNSPQQTHASAAWAPPVRGRINFLLAAYVALLPLQIAPDPNLRLGIADVALFAYFLFNVSRVKLVRWAWGTWHVALVCLFAFGLFVTASNTGSLTRYIVLNKALGLITLLMAYAAITSEVETWLQLRKVLRIFVLSVVLQNLVAMAALSASYLAGATFPFINYENERLAGMMFDPNAYGGLLLVALAFNVAGSSGPAPITRGWLRIVCDVTLAAGILFTFSRSTWLALGIAWLTFLFFRPRPAMRMAAAVSPVVPVLLLLMGTGLISTERMVKRTDTIDSRMALIYDSLNQFSQHPVLGMGLGGFRESGRTIVHNTFFWFLTDFGFVGALIFAAFIAWFALAGIRSYFLAPAEMQKFVLGPLMALIGMLGLSMGIEAFYQRHWWLSFALIGAANAITSKIKVSFPRAAMVNAFACAPGVGMAQRTRILARTRI